MRGVVRPENPTDSDAIRKVHLDAFSSVAEADLVKSLGESDDIAVSLVCDLGAKIVGHVLLSRMNVVADGKPVKSAGLAPVAVLPENQHDGIGTQLMRRAIEQARLQGYKLIFLLGDPAYYQRFGFDVRSAERFESRYSGPFFQLLVLDEAFVLPKSGKADYAPAFATLEDE